MPVEPNFADVRAQKEQNGKVENCPP